MGKPFAFTRWVEVALPVPVDSTFRYGVPPAFAAAVQVGARVVVPFGAQRLTGVVVSIESSPDVTGAAGGAADTAFVLEAPQSEGARRKPRIRPVERLLDPKPVIPPDLLRVLSDAAAEVFCPIGLALAAALPAGSAPKRERAFWLTDRGQRALESGALREELLPILESLRAGPRKTNSVALRRAGGDAGRLRELTREGLIREGRLEGAATKAPTRRVARLDPNLDRDGLLASLAKAPAQRALIERLAAHGPCEVATLLGEGGRGRSALHALTTRGAVSIEEQPVSRGGAPAALAAGSRRGDDRPTLTDAQAEAFRTLRVPIEAGRYEPFLLHGVTGSGKTEVYLRAIEATLALGRQSLVLVPEITLTHQLVARLEERFGTGVAVLHSGLRRGERVGEWRRVLEGGAPIVVGARSALLAPLEALGLIVMDEEHDSAYKSEDGFRYHARDLATRRAAAQQCPLILGSATPALETRYAAESGDIRRLVLPRRIGGRPLPAVELVDLEAERAFLPRGRKLILSRALARALRETLEQGAQAILFLNRRGFSTRIFCFDCGHAERCHHCDVSLVYHATDRKLRCHYCDAEREPPDHCGECGAPETALLGIGTQRLEEEVRRLFPEARIGRLDRDAAARRGTTESILGALSAGELDILVGTQMVAKGHDFPGVRLVGVISGDLSLHHPDFRAAERTFQLLTQVAGRAGRGAAPGRVIVQTFTPDHYAIRPVVDHDYERFFREEIRQRSAAGFPPCGGLLRVLVTAPDAESAREAAATLATLARSHDDGNRDGRTPPSFEILGPAPAPLARLRDRDRVHLLIKDRDRKRLAQIGSQLARAAREIESRDLRISVDPNPQNML